ncbi:hypothetical protein RMSM_02330 [Rhodopirellula maiorica SM1]|uniref:Uncharacterized protein n=1 Tax=Rhodopirellula maiorica SM1 TaxID=1265738 RepID=M5RN43_9BACT|nr:hypothetical protein RMSM_02330 [Rhodopirellula maiorica SM1]
MQTDLPKATSCDLMQHDFSRRVAASVTPLWIVVPFGSGYRSCVVPRTVTTSLPALL